jgi:hypothetical protein
VREPAWDEIDGVPREILVPLRRAHVAGWVALGVSVVLLGLRIPRWQSLDGLIVVFRVLEMLLIAGLTIGILRRNYACAVVLWVYLSLWWFVSIVVGHGPNLAHVVIAAVVYFLINGASACARYWRHRQGLEKPA